MGPGCMSPPQPQRPRVVRLRNQMSAGRVGRTDGCTLVGVGRAVARGWTRGTGRVTMPDRVDRGTDTAGGGAVRRV
jgi:hypothetical protein